MEKQVTKNNKTYYILDNKAYMPNSCWGGYNYRKIAIMSCPKDVTPSRNIVDTTNYTIEELWDRVHKGTTDRDEYTEVMQDVNQTFDAITA